jgi:hypothetical protein
MTSIPYDVETGLEDTKDLSIGAASTKSITTISLGGNALKKTLSRAFLSTGMPVTFKVSMHLYTRMREIALYSLIYLLKKDCIYMILF